MKVRRTITAAAADRRLAVASCATLTVVVSATVSACSGSPSSTPAIFSPSVSVSTTSSGFYSGTASVRPTPAGSHSARSTNSSSPRPSASSATRAAHTPTPQLTRSAGASSSHYPTMPPSTGGGGTAGLRDGLLFGVGGAAMLLGAGSLAYRRKVIKSR